jgi:hypothetical protein
MQPQTIRVRAWSSSPAIEESAPQERASSSQIAGTNMSANVLAFSQESF